MIRKFLNLKASIVAFGLIFSVQAGAQEMASFYSGVRQLGMGGAYAAVVNDETSLLTNPAGLGRIRDFTFTLADPELSGSVTDTAIAKLDNVSTVLDLQGLLTALNQAKGTHWFAKAQFFPSIVGPNFGFGILGKYNYNAEVSTDGTVFRLDYTNDYAAALGNCFRFFGGIVKLGTSFRMVNRTEVHQDLAANSTNLQLSQIASQGMGLAADVGLNITAPVALLPTISVVAHDIGGTAYNLSDGLFGTSATRPISTKQTLDGGFAISPILSNHVRFTFTGEFRDIAGANHKDGDVVDIMRQVHAGGEFNFADFFFLRAGLNQRYWTAGFELASERFQLQAATYGEEIGVAPATREDRRWVGKISFRF